MKITKMLDGNVGSRASVRKNVLFHVLLVVIFICVMAGETANAAYPILLLDIGRGHNEAEIQEGFTAFTVGDSGTVVDGIMIEVGTTEAELVEFLNVAITESGCPGEQWAMKSLQIFKDLEVGKHNKADICCKETN